MKLYLICILILSINLCAFAQQITVNGKITDENNKPIPFASVYIKNTTKGTSANSEGEYVLQLTPGTYNVQYKAVGYKQESRDVELKTSKTVNVSMKTEAYQLNDVVI